MAERFYINSAIDLGPVRLEGPEAHHLAVVCRVRPGDQVYLFNGDGRQYLATVGAVQKKGVDLNVINSEAPARELGFPLEVAAPLPKMDRASFLIEKLTELGATSFVPLRSDRSVVHPRETRLEKLHRTVVEASKQCGRNVLMRVEPLVNWEDYVKRDELPRNKLLAHPGSESVAGAIQQVNVGGGYAVAVGPEGGFTDAEVIVAQAAGWRLVSLGSRILRVETSALMLAALVNGVSLGRHD
jgi:16S rRNA (uracil1498-N3)-methyltransferase